jgi:hypothetical protein
MNQQNTETQSASDDEISLTEIIEFFAENLKDILLCALIGMVTGASYFFINASYVNTVAFRNDAQIDIPLLKKLTQALPIYAKQLEIKDDLYKKISNEKYWKENLKPTFVMSKDDAKEFQIDKVEQGSTISNFKLSFKGSDKNKNQTDSEEVFNFFIDTFIKIKITELLQKYKTEIQTGQLGLDKKNTEIKNEIDYLKLKAKNLEELKIRFPNNQGTSFNQVLDPKDSASKYLPISTQLVAIYTELNNLNEQLKRSQDGKDALDIKEKFLFEFENINKETKPEAEKVKKLFQIFSDNLMTLEKNNGYKLSTTLAYRRLLTDLNDILTVDKLGFEAIDRTSEYATKPISILVGAFSGLMFGIFFAFALKVKKKYKEENRKTSEVKELSNA